jgi:hypothetical protein
MSMKKAERVKCSECGKLRRVADTEEDSMGRLCRWCAMRIERELVEDGTFPDFDENGDEVWHTEDEE